MQWQLGVESHFGDYGGSVPPVPIPNTEVKPPCAYGTAGLPGGRVGRCRNDCLLQVATFIRIDLDTPFLKNCFLDYLSQAFCID